MSRYENIMTDGQGSAGLLIGQSTTKPRMAGVVMDVVCPILMLSVPSDNIASPGHGQGMFRSLDWSAEG